LPCLSEKILAGGFGGWRVVFLMDAMDWYGLEWTSMDGRGGMNLGGGFEILGMGLP
jgi:hypothetical protein